MTAEKATGKVHPAASLQTHVDWHYKGLCAGPEQQPEVGKPTSMEILTTYIGNRAGHSVTSMSVVTNPLGA